MTITTQEFESLVDSLIYLILQASKGQTQDLSKKSYHLIQTLLVHNVNATDHSLPDIQ